MKYLEGFSGFGGKQIKCDMCGKLIPYHPRYESVSPRCVNCRSFLAGKKLKKLIDPAIPGDFSREQRNDVKKYNL